MKKIVQHSIPTLRSISAEGFHVNNILDELVPRSAKRYRIVPNLNRVVLHGQATCIARAGRAIAAGLWPALEKFIVPHCSANASYFSNLAHGIRSGCVPNLRLLRWDHQTTNRKRSLDSLLLSALAAGKCPRIERLSFTENDFCPEYRIDSLRDALRACPNLRVLRMDCSRDPGNELRAVTAALEAGEVPRLTYLFMRSTKAYHPSNRTKEGVRALKQAAAARVPPVRVETEIKTSYARTTKQE